jgi:hypothetical protein
VRLLEQFNEAAGAGSFGGKIGPLVVQLIQLGGAQAWEIQRIRLARKEEKQQLGDELAVRAERILVLVARVQPERKLEFWLALLLPGQSDYERAKITGPGIAHFLARERSTGLESDKQIANLVGPIRLYQDDGKLGLPEGQLEFLGKA